MEARLQLLEIVQATCRAGLFLDPGERGQQQRRQNGDDGDDHEQLDERKAGAPEGSGGGAPTMATLLTTSGRWDKRFHSTHTILWASKNNRPGRFPPEKSATWSGALRCRWRRGRRRIHPHSCG